MQCSTNIAVFWNTKTVSYCCFGQACCRRLQVRKRNVKVASCCEILLPVHQTAQCHITEGVSLHQHYCAYLRYRMKELIMHPVHKIMHTSNVHCGDNYSALQG